ncbi:MAG: tetratricopeptide repeat protein [Acetobacter cibinongensis]
MTHAAPNVTTPDPTTLRRAQSEIKAGNFASTLEALKPFTRSKDEQTQLLLAACLAGTGKAEKAAKTFCAFAAAKPTEQHPLQPFTDLLIELGKREESLPVCRAAIALTPEDARVYDILGSILVQMGAFDEGVDLLRQSVALRPDNSFSANLLAMALSERGDTEECLAVLEATLNKNPTHAGTLSNMGCALSAMGRMEDAFNFYRKAIFYNPTHPQIRLNHSISLLKAGRYAQGWTEHEWRLKLPGHSNLPSATLMPSLGPDSDIRGKRVLITQEEGLGDTLMYLRYIEPLAKRGAIPHLWVPDTLGDLCRRVNGAAIVQVGGDVPEFDWHCPFISLPRVFSATEDAMGASVPYLKADAAKIREFAALVPHNGKLNVGLIWGGAPRPTLVGAYMTDRRRSMPLETLAPLAQVQGLNLISLQKGPYADQLQTPPDGMTIYDPTDELLTMDDTAALLMSLDVLVSVDTSCVHLAGALGKPVLLMDRFDNCWRWLHNTPTSPWYPTLRIIRQSKPREWHDVIETVCAGLRDMARYKALRSAKA